MSFRCDNCGKARPTGERPVKVVIRKRLKHYRDEAFGSEIEHESDIGQCCTDEITEVATPVPWESDNALKAPVGKLPGYESGRVNSYFAEQRRG